MATEIAAKSSKPAPKKISQEQIIGGFNQLRQEQRAMSTKVVELEGDQSEHNLVLEALKDVDGNRKCFRMIGGVLVERTVKEVVPSLEKNRNMITQLVDSLKAQTVTKGKEINDYMEKHNIQIRQDSQMNEAPPREAESSSSGVLVSAANASS